jgi:hypothetical protein
MTMLIIITVLMPWRLQWAVAVIRVHTPIW